MQDREEALVLSLGASGKMPYKEHSLECDQAVSLIVESADQMRIDMPYKHRGVIVKFSAPGDWVLDSSKGSGIVKKGKVFLVRIHPRNVRGGRASEKRGWMRHATAASRGGHIVRPWASRISR